MTARKKGYTTGYPKLSKPGRGRRAVTDIQAMMRADIQREAVKKAARSISAKKAAQTRALKKAETSLKAAGTAVKAAKKEVAKTPAPKAPRKRTTKKKVA